MSDQPAENIIEDRDLGIYPKYVVRRTDGSDLPGGKHHGCEHFVLDITHDPFAIPALKAYAVACRATHPKLADDLEQRIHERISARSGRREK